MIVNKINSNSLSKIKSASIIHPFRLISSCNVFFKDSKDSSDGNSGNDQSKKDNLHQLLKDLAKRSGINELPPEQKINLAEPRKMQRQKLKEEAAQKLIDDQDEKKQPIGTRLESAAKNVAKALGGDETKTESELLNALLSFKKEGEPKNIIDIVKGMQTETTEKRETLRTRSQTVRESMVGKSLPEKFISRKAGAWIPDESLRLFSDEGLNIFPPEYMSTAKDTVTLTTWNELVDQQIKYTVTHTPKNYFEEMIQWTEHSKLWHFPIDNEQGMEEEKKVHFSEHIMLYDLLDPWCPARGPIRHFMELVCVGLSKNHHYTVKEKRDHINFYREYFKEKNDILRETGCGEILDIPSDVKPDQTEASEKTVES